MKVIVKWEKAVGLLREAMLNASEKNEEKGWPWIDAKGKKVEGWRKQWEFRGSWGKGSGVGEVAPDEVL